MPSHLKRYHTFGHDHFITFSCYHRLPYLNDSADSCSLLTTLASYARPSGSWHLLLLRRLQNVRRHRFRSLRLRLHDGLRQRGSACGAVVYGMTEQAAEKVLEFALRANYEGLMRGDDGQPLGVFSYVSAEDFDLTTALIFPENSQDYGELRYQAIGFLDARLYVLTFTEAEDSIHAISLRKAEKSEERICADED